MYLAQQLSPNIRRIRFVPDGGVPERLPDPALGEWGRDRLANAVVESHETLEAALGTAVAPLRLLDRAGADGAVRIEFALEAEERIWGAYDADAGSFDRRGDHVHLVTEIHPRGRHVLTSRCDLCSSGPDAKSIQLEIGNTKTSNYGELVLPSLFTSRGWGAYVSSAWHDAQLDLGARTPDAVAYTAPGGEADVYLFGPGGPAQLVAELVRLTGHQPLPPAWALGFLQSRFGYESFDHVHGTLARFQEEQLPVHAVVYDVQWLEHHINLRWDPVTFPDPELNLARTRDEHGVRTVVITEPGTTSIASNHASGVAAGAFVTGHDEHLFDSQQWYTKRGISQYREIEPSDGALLNVFNERAADWWYEQHLPLVAMGVDAWWLDLNEPEDVGVDISFPNTDWPAERAVVDGAEVRANFAIAQQRLFARRDRKHTERRPFVLTRSGSTGSQRYGSAPWTGDVSSTWHDLAVQSRLMLTLGLCGIPLSGSDVGGFNGDPGPELFARWMQAGSVMPIFRAHGYMQDREPWSQGPEALAALRPSLLLRAQLLPSIASWTREALEAGEPLARPMLLGPLGTDAQSDDAAAYAADPRWSACDDQWFFGPLLAAPVLEEGQAVRTVQLPPGTWVDVWTGTRHAGGGSIDVAVTASTLPLFVQPDVALVADAAPLDGRGHAWPPPQLEVWSWAGAGETATARFYLDDGISREHEAGTYCLQELAVEAGAVRVERLAGSLPARPMQLVAPHPGTASDKADT